MDVDFESSIPHRIMPVKALDYHCEKQIHTLTVFLRIGDKVVHGLTEGDTD